MKHGQYNANSNSNQSLFEKFRIFVYYDDILCLLYYVYLLNYCGKIVEKMWINQQLYQYIDLIILVRHNILVINIFLCKRDDLIPICYITSPPLFVQSFFVDSCHSANCVPDAEYHEKHNKSICSQCSVWYPGIEQQK